MVGEGEWDCRFLSFFCAVCSAVSRLISWALCFPVFTRVGIATHLKVINFLAW